MHRQLMIAAGKMMSSEHLEAFDVSGESEALRDRYGLFPLFGGGDLSYLGPVWWTEANDDGERSPMDVKVGDRVLVGKYSGSDIKIDEEDYVILREDEVLAVIE